MEQVKIKAHWKYHPSTMFIAVCSNCGCEIGNLNMLKGIPIVDVCPNCNAEMETEKKGE